MPEEAAAKINRNPDWICVYCKQLNSDDNETCVYCGAPRASENLNYFQNKEKSDSKAEPVSDDSDDSDSFEEHTTSEHEEVLKTLKVLMKSRIFRLLKNLRTSTSVQFGSLH